MSDNNVWRRLCEVCTKDITKDHTRCTNNRCGDCHSKYCTPGGNDSPGHGRGAPHTPPQTIK